jgi:hypothetical protein
LRADITRNILSRIATYSSKEPVLVQLDGAICQTRTDELGLYKTVALPTELRWLGFGRSGCKLSLDQLAKRATASFFSDE